MKIKRMGSRILARFLVSVLRCEIGQNELHSRGFLPPFSNNEISDASSEGGILMTMIPRKLTVIRAIAEWTISDKSLRENRLGLEICHFA